MAINKDNRLKALHCCYTAGTGGGKSVAVQYGGMMPKSPCLAIFDPYEDYLYITGSDTDIGFAGKRTYTYRTRQAFAKAFMNAWSSKKPFRICYTPANPSREEMLWFSLLMWHASDGQRRLDMVVEEVAKWCNTTAKEQSAYGECLTGGRKYGLVVHSVFQRSTEVPKTTISQSPFKIIGMQETEDDAKRMAKECRLTIDDMAELTPLNYIKKHPGLTGQVERISLEHVFD
ncbi:hypothetical protein EXU30_00055 [Shewanella maritima]|uniref:Uncharacterized protein n=1 Tax=Shewanella maritima TaxID=2520507 RepID=A0A411PCU9_9GAMM|nr:hypothetical protein [Shewanella maritima]QBF81262.1 hypothetical protein EXU30_00055 [Shewanella maritima]